MFKFFRKRSNNRNGLTKQEARAFTTESSGRVSTTHDTLNMTQQYHDSSQAIEMVPLHKTLDACNVENNELTVSVCQGNMGSSQENFGVSRENLAESREDVISMDVSRDRITNNGAALSMSSHNSKSVIHKKSKKESLETKREKKAAKTLAIITGAFVICWLPFFVTVLVMTICRQCWMSDLMFSIFLWLGYFNSTLNPIIYTIFSPEFRQAFKRILCGKKNQRYRPGKRS